MSLHFKFRSAVEYDSVDIEGHFISVINLKDKIIEAKNLGKGTDFDLLITNAQSGEEYADDGLLVPKNTSVIIKRVPAARTKSTLRVDDLPKSCSEQSGLDYTRGSDAAGPLATPSDVNYDGMDDFGVDLYAIPEPQPARIGFSEDSQITSIVNKTAADWQRQAQEPFSGGGGRGFGRLASSRVGRGRGYARAIPPQGYVCHRCSQPGHFIQHCPTNGDPSYDIRRIKLPVGIPKIRLKADQEGGYILPDGSVAVMQPDESVFAKEADALFSIRPTLAEPPPELRCPLCQAIFKDAVMIPCCHYSFCDQCIRQELMLKGKCPQCGSSKFRNDDLLPNIALRQAIDRFIETQVPTASADEGHRLQPAADVELASSLKAPARLQIELRKPDPSSTLSAAPKAVGKDVSLVIIAEPINDLGIAVAEKISRADADLGANAIAEAKASVVVVPSSDPQSSEVIAVQCSKTDESVSYVHPAIMKDVPDFVKGGMDTVIDDGGGMVTKMFEPPSHKEAEGVAVESEVSKGKKKKKRPRLISGDGSGDYMSGGKGKRMQGDRVCYICGSPEHLARDCLRKPDIAYPLHPGMFGPGPPGLPPHCPDMYWQGPPMPGPLQPGRPFPGSYGEGIYIPGPMPFDAPMGPRGPYNMGACLPPMYQRAQVHGGFMGGGVPTALGPMERLLHREEFMEMQERQRHYQLMHEHINRDWSPERSYFRDGKWLSRTPDSEWRSYEIERRGNSDTHQGLMREQNLNRELLRNYSSENGLFRRKYDHKHASLINSHAYQRKMSNSDDDSASFDTLRSRELLQENHGLGGKTPAMSSKREDSHQQDEHGDRFSSELEDEMVKLRNSARHHEKGLEDGDLPIMKMSRESSKMPDDTNSVCVAGSVGTSHSRRHRDRKNIVDAGKHDMDYSEEKGFLRAGKQVQGLFRSPEQVGRFRLNEYIGSEVDAHAEIRDLAKGRRRKHRGHLKPKAELGHTKRESDDDLKKKKRKHRKYHEMHSLEKGSRDAVEDHCSKNHKHKSKYGSHGIMSSLSDLECSRWQLDSDHDLGIACQKARHSRLQWTDNGKVN